MNSLRVLLALHVYGVDGKLGKVHDFYCDDSTWKIEYVVVCRGLFPMHCFVASPERFAEPPWSTTRPKLCLSKRAAEGGASAGSVETVKEHERRLLKEFFGISDVPKYPGRWEPHESTVTPEEVETAERGLHALAPDRSLRSISELLDYAVDVHEGPAARVEDFLVGEDNWLVEYLVVSTKGYSTFSQRLLVPTAWIESISWEDSTISLRLGREKLHSCQLYVPASHAQGAALS